MNTNSQLVIHSLHSGFTSVAKVITQISFLHGYLGGFIGIWYICVRVDLASVYLFSIHLTPTFSFLSPYVILWFYWLLSIVIVIVIFLNCIFRFLRCQNRRSIQNLIWTSMWSSSYLWLCIYPLLGGPCNCWFYTFLYLLPSFRDNYMEIG